MDIVLTQEAQSALQTKVDQYEREGELHRQSTIAECKKLSFFWEGYQYLTRSMSDGGKYVSPELDPELFTDDEEDLYYTKVINIHKAHGESIIAALSTGLPAVTFFPLNADNSDDVMTAKAYKQISEIVQRHNKAKLLLIQAIWILYNQNFVAARIRAHEHERYGTYEEPVYEDRHVLICDACKFQFVPQAAPQTDEVTGEQIPQLDGMGNEIPPTNPNACPQCGGNGSEAVFSEQVGTETRAKSRTYLEFYGPLNVYIPRYASSIEDIPFLRLADDIHVDVARSLYKDYAEKIKEASDTLDFERWGRLPLQVDESDAQGLTYRYQYWLKPCAYTSINDEVVRQELETNFPDGVHLTYVNDILVAVEAEELDDVWVVSKDPRAATLHADPIGRPVVPIQETLNDTFNLTTQTIEHGVPETFADPEVLNFKEYGESRVRPGQISQAKPKPGKVLGDAFFTVKTATVSQEIDKFFSKLEQLGQFVVGSFPSIYGGQMAGSRTAAEYSMSRQQALQRLSTIWAVVTDFWTRSIFKATKHYANNMKSDEFFVAKNGSSFINMWVYAAHLNGSVGEVETETSEQLPISMMQKKDEISSLMQLQSDQINAVLADPQNASFIKEVFGLPELYVPGAYDREKMLEDIDRLLKTEPSGEMPSIPPDEDLDNHEVCIETCRQFLLSERGRVAKELNPAGYMNVMLRMRSHKLIIQQQQIQQQQQMAMMGQTNGIGPGNSGQPGTGTE